MVAVGYVYARKYIYWQMVWRSDLEKTLDLASGRVEELVSAVTALVLAFDDCRHIAERQCHMCSFSSKDTKDRYKMAKWCAVRPNSSLQRTPRFSDTDKKGCHELTYTQNETGSM